MYQTTMKIEGMMCGMCEAHIADTIRRTIPSARKVSASRNRKEASFLSTEMVDCELLKDAINKTGYICTQAVCVPYEKKGLFAWK